MPPIAGTYDYLDAAGALLYRTVRFADPKDFRQRRPDRKGGWIYKEALVGVDRVPYRLPELLTGLPSRTVFIVEGEKDANRLAAQGLLATCNAGGAEKWTDALSEHLRGRAHVAVLADNDDPGRRHAEQVARSVTAVAAVGDVRVIALPGLPEHGDVSDWLDSGHGREDLQHVVNAASRWEPAKPAPAGGETATPIDTATLLNEMRVVLRRYLILPDEHFYDVVALWVLHAHTIAAADTSPRLIFKSPEKESGKTRALEVLELLVPAPLAVMNTTIAAIFRLLKDEQATVLFDEVDAVFNSKVGNYEDLRALLNAGYRRGATVARVVGEGKGMRTERYPVFAATALAAIGDLPDTIESRAIILPMRRRAPDEYVEQFRRRRVAAQLEEMRSGLFQWGTEHIDKLGAADPAMPDELTDRAADCWEPVLAIADLAGGDWPKRAREAAIAVVKGRVAEDASVGVRLLADIKVVMEGKDRMPSAALCAALNGLEESGWGAWNDGKGISQRELAKRLKRYGVDSKVIRLTEDSTPRGYLRIDLLDAFARYLRVPPPSGSATGATSATPIRIHVADVADVALGRGMGHAGNAVSSNGATQDPDAAEPAHSRVQGTVPEMSGDVLATGAEVF